MGGTAADEGVLLLARGLLHRSDRPGYRDAGIVREVPRRRHESGRSDAGGHRAPDRVIDITRLPLAGIDDLPDGSLRIGALARNSRWRMTNASVGRYPLLARAILSGASPQLRNRATVGGNLLQRTRCGYFYDTASACNKRVPGVGCDALGGFHRMHAILGASESCIAVHPSDMCVALAALDAVVNIEGPLGARRAVPLTEFHRLPGDTPHIETVLEHGELVTAIDLPPAPPGRTSYTKVRDRASFAFALASVAVRLHVEAGRTISARIALGGVAHKPWRAATAEAVLLDHAPTPDEPFAPRGRRGVGAGRAAGPQWHSRLSWPNALIVATLSELAAGGAR